MGIPRGHRDELRDDRRGQQRVGNHGHGGDLHELAEVVVHDRPDLVSTGQPAVGAEHRGDRHVGQLEHVDQTAEDAEVAAVDQHHAEAGEVERGRHADGHARPHRRLRRGAQVEQVLRHPHHQPAHDARHHHDLHQHRGPLAHAELVQARARRRVRTGALAHLRQVARSRRQSRELRGVLGVVRERLLDALHPDLAVGVVVYDPDLHVRRLGRHRHDRVLRAAGHAHRHDRRHGRGHHSQRRHFRAGALRDLGKPRAQGAQRQN